MLLILILILSLGVYAASIGVAAFEFTVAVILATPVLAFPVAQVLGPSWYVYLMVGGALVAAATWVQHQRGVARIPVAQCMRTQSGAIMPIVVWVAVAVIAYLFCLLWPDFVSIGERLRDYAILSAVLQHPLEAREPWMSGATLNYYLFWYRFGAMLASLGGLAVWQTYHVLQSITVALYFAIFFRFFTRHLGFRVFSALGCAAIMTFGSNLAGVVAYAKQDSNWWGPSRVIPGTINEFPAWSFLLGDLHPHFLNLPLLPALILLGLELSALFARQSWWMRVAAVLSWVAVTVAWTFGANAWELPFALITSVIVIVGLGFYRRAAVREADAPTGIAWRWCVAALLFLVGCAALLWAQSRNITPPGDPLRLVTLPFGTQLLSSIAIAMAELVHIKLQPPTVTVAGSPVGALLLHWGFPLGLLGMSLIVLSRDWMERVGKAMVLVLGYLSGSALVLLGFMAILQIWRLIEQLRDSDRTQLLSGPFVAELLGLAAIMGVMFPEVLFIDDPYGGADERMNTVFKFYSAAWGFMHLAAFALGAQLFQRICMAGYSPRIFWATWGVTLTLLLGFFLSSIKYRIGTQFTVKPYAQGLSGVEAQYAGAGRAIQKLEHLPRGVVLEAQGGAYNFSSMVSTLSGNEAFLGWANHINLLTRNYSEVSRREQLTKDFYTRFDCNQRREMMEQEGIRYAVVGRLEQQGYGSIPVSGLGCLESVVHEGEYSVFTLPEKKG